MVPKASFERSRHQSDKANSADPVDPPWLFHSEIGVSKSASSGQWNRLALKALLCPAASNRIRQEE